MSTTLRTRSPSDVGYLAWAVHRLSAVALLLLLMVHLGVQLFPQYGFDTIYGLGVYGTLLNITLGVVLLHGFLGIRATVLETSVTNRMKTLVVWMLGVLVFGFFLFRILG